MKRIKREERICNCNCGNVFECREDSRQKFIHGHNARTPEYSGMRVKREIRFCQCSCGQSFECKITSKQKFIFGHQVYILNEGLKKMQELWSNPDFVKIRSLQTKELWGNEDYRTKQTISHKGNESSLKDKTYEEIHGKEKAT